ncbi:hypothetical protein [Chondromyces apiculatus]|uniref:Uncharacterized protein n=1 Tax=Chondromyces apiculatus DSM 436 TaxID=1192034 RepID=A0A017T991_9BACT|nr:hypothetical protein [Chondromyces apiculatus]EYF05385.1 Hypothetical protein CAP_3302 [Chondromyces apiculatus DSM 436]
MNAEFNKFRRVALRCAEVANEPGAPAVLVTVYAASVAGPLQAYLAAEAGVEAAMNRLNRAESQMNERIEGIDQQFRVVRSAVTAVQPDLEVPVTLKMQRTDTDKRMAIEQLVAVVTTCAGQPWADGLLQGEFGDMAEVAVAQFTECAEAANALQKARNDRLAAAEPAWEAYMRFKRLVRETLKSTSRQYRRLHLRSGKPLEDDEEEPGKVEDPKTATVDVKNAAPERTVGAVLAEAEEEVAPAEVAEEAEEQETAAQGTKAVRGQEKVAPVEVAAVTPGKSGKAPRRRRPGGERPASARA